MGGKPSDWKPDEEEALKALIRAAIEAAGEQDHAVLPSKIRERIKGRLTGAMDLDAYIADVLREQKKRG